MLLPWPPRRLVLRTAIPALGVVVAAFVTVPLLAACDTPRPIVTGFGLGGGGGATTSPVTASASSGGTGGAPAGTGGGGGAGNDDAGADGG
jgi:hypothetical protein